MELEMYRNEVLSFVYIIMLKFVKCLKGLIALHSLAVNCFILMLSYY